MEISKLLGKLVTFTAFKFTKDVIKYESWTTLLLLYCYTMSLTLSGRRKT